jgi:tight adherence protein B
MAGNRFGGILSMVLLLGIFNRESKKLDKRLTEYVSGQEEGESQVTAVTPSSRDLVNERIDKALKGRGFADTISRKLTQADMRLTVGEFLGLKIVSAGAGFGLGFFFGRGAGVFAFIIAGVVAVIGLYVPDIMVGRKGKKRIKNFNNQLGDTITLLANGLRSGNSLLQAMELVSREGAPPMSDEFSRIIREVGLGLSTREALANVQRRVPSEDLDLLITAINIQSEVGGNLAQILDNIGHTIRERVRIKGEIKVLTAQQQYAGYIISGMPVALAFVLYLIAPQYMTKMFAWPFICMPICSIILILIGFAAIMKIVDIDI